MLLSGRPLYDNRADTAYFATPPEWNALVEAVDRGLNVLVVGQRGVGKTTLLRQLQLALRNSGEEVAFVDATAVPDVLELTSRVRDAVRGQPAAVVEGASSAVEAFRAEPAPVAGASRALASLLRAIGETEARVILVDGSAAAEAVYELFGRMRDVLWQQKHRWVVAIDENDRATVLRPPADAFFDVTVALRPWPTNELVDLLARRGESDLPVPNDLLVAVASGAEGNPRNALRALNDAVVHGRDAASLLDERGRLLDRASELGRAPGMLMAELLDRGQASSSDADLQATLGVTRSRLTQLLRELLEHGLVLADNQRADGPGRPRTVYRPALPR